MFNNSLISSVFDNIGFILNEKLNKEIMYFYPLIFDEKNREYSYQNSYKIFENPFGSFFAYFLNTNFKDIESFKEFFLEYTFLLIDNNSRNNYYSKTYKENELELFIEKMYEKNCNRLLRLQQQVDKILDYCILNPKNKKIEYTPLQRFFVLQATNENLTLLQNTKILTSNMYFINNKAAFNSSEKDLYSILATKYNKIDKITLAIPISIESLLYYSLCKIMENKIKIKTCNICGRYFITKNILINYCNNIAPGHDCTCKELGRKFAFNKTTNEDPLLTLYYKIYARKSILARRNPDITEYVKEFDSFKNVGKRKLKEYKNNDLSKDDFSKWLNKKNKLI